MNTYEYEEKIVAYIDILGFKKLVKSSPDANKIGNILETINGLLSTLYDLTKMEKFAEIKNFPTSSVQFEYTLFSDNLVISTPCEAAGLSAVIQLTGELCERLAKDNIYIRGGITHGKIYHKGNVIFGPALVDAYLLECDGAMYPRVIINEETLRIHFPHMEPIFRQEEPTNECEQITLNIIKKFVSEHVCLCEDGYYAVTWQFIDSESRDSLLLRIDKYLNELKQEQNSSGDRRAVQKISWLKNYLKNQG